MGATATATATVETAYLNEFGIPSSFAEFENSFASSEYLAAYWECRLIGHLAAAEQDIRKAAARIAGRLADTMALVDGRMHAGGLAARLHTAPAEFDRLVSVRAHLLAELRVATGRYRRDHNLALPRS
jgi:hypothetical protein